MLHLIFREISLDQCDPHQSSEIAEEEAKPSRRKAEGRRSQGA